MRNIARCATGHDRPESAVTIAGIRNYSYGGDSIMLPRHILTIEFDGRYSRSVIQDKVSVKLEQQIDHIVKRVDDKLKKKAADHLRKLCKSPPDLC